MLFDRAYLIFLLIATSTSDRSSIDDFRETISLSSVTGSSLIFQSNLIDFKSAKKLSWYRGRTHLERIEIIPSDVQKISSKSSSHYRLLNETFLFIERTARGDEGFYTLKLFITSTKISNYLFHVINRCALYTTNAFDLGSSVCIQSIINHLVSKRHEEHLSGRWLRQYHLCSTVLRRSTLCRANRKIIPITVVHDSL